MGGSFKYWYKPRITRKKHFLNVQFNFICGTILKSTFFGFFQH